MATITKMIENFVSEERFSEVKEMIKQFNERRAVKHNDPDWDCYYIFGVTGSKENYFTLYKHIQTGARAVSHIAGVPGGLLIHERYVQNLSTNFEEALTKVMSMLESSNWPLRIDGCDNTTYEYNREDTVMHFGKYNGNYIEDIRENDINYLFWLRDYLYEKMENNKKFAESKRNQRLQDIVNDQIDFYFDTLRKYNEENSKSQFVGKVGDKLENIQLTVTKSAFEFDEWNKNIVISENLTMVDENENVFTMYINASTKNFTCTQNAEGRWQHSLLKGDKILVSTARIASQYTRLGIDCNRLKNVKFSKVA